jgi:hypothetical protein
MRFIFYFPLIAMLFSVTAYAQSDAAGTRAFEFLKLDDNARTIAMGGASAALPNGLYGAAINPASCGFLEKTQAMLGCEALLMDAWAGPMAYAFPYQNYGVFSASLHYVSHGYLNGSEALDESGNPTGATWHVYSMVGSMGWSKIVFNQFSVGLSVKAIHHSIGSTQQYHTSSDGVAADAGFQYRMDNSRFIVAGAFQNAGVLLSNFTQESEKRRLPFSATIGLSYIPRYSPGSRLAFDVQKTNEGDLNYKPGFESALFKKMVFVRGGLGFSELDLEELIKELKNKPDENYVKSNASGLSFGVGIVTDIEKVSTNIDISCMTRFYGLPPSVMLSLLFEY